MNATGDVFVGSAGSDTIFGGAGWDTVQYSSARAKNLVSPASADTSLVTKPGFGQVLDTMSSVEQLDFSDGSLLTNVNGNTAFRLYKAALNRLPDIGGLV